MPIKLIEREFTTEQRKKLAKEGKAEPDRSYPIETVEDLENAIQAWGRGGATASDKAWIIKRARALGATDRLPDDWKEAVAWEELCEAAQMPMEHVMNKVNDAVRQKHGTPSPTGEGMMYGYVPVHATYPDSVVFSKPGDSKMYRAPYKVEKGDVQLGDEKEVVPAYQDADGDECKESIKDEAGRGHVARFLEADKTGKIWEVLLVEKGTSKNGYHYTESMLRETVPLFNGVYSFADHTNDHEQKIRPERSVKDKVGRFSEARYGQVRLPDGRITEGVVAKFKVVAPWLRELLKESVELDEPDFVGFSIDALGKSIPKQVGGNTVKEVQSIRKIFSVDVVTLPSAGGRATRLIESDQTIEGGDNKVENEGKTETPALTAEAISAIVANAIKEATTPLLEKLGSQDKELESMREAHRVRSNDAKVDLALSNAEGLSDSGKNRLRSAFREAASRRDLTDDEINTSIKEALDYEAALLQPYMVGRSGGARVTGIEHERLYHALVGMFENKDQKYNDTTVPRFRSLKEAYCRWTGADAFDVDPMEIQRGFSVNYDSAVDHKKIQESVTRAQWGQIYADVLYLQLIKAYRANPLYDQWRRVVSDIENVPDFQTRHWTRVGGYSDLATVAEAATYDVATSPTDEEVTYSVSKYGVLEDVTFEAIANDRVGAVRRIPTNMARAAVRTLYKFVMNMVTTDNPSMDYDSTTLYHANHSNTGTTALTLTGVQTVLTAMRSQTAYSETQEILGPRNKPRVLIVPNELELVAQRIVAPSDAFLAALTAPSASGELDPQAFKGMGIEYLVYDVLTDVNDWFAVADPNEVPTVVLGFLNGREEPELFVQDQPNVGSNFTADKITYKIRHIYGGDVLDHRSFYRMVV